jgi:hypothetical protein
MAMKPWSDPQAAAGQDAAFLCLSSQFPGVSEKCSRKWL